MNKYKYKIGDIVYYMGLSGYDYSCVVLITGIAEDELYEFPYKVRVLKEIVSKKNRPTTLFEDAYRKEGLELRGKLINYKLWKLIYD